MRITVCGVIMGVLCVFFFFFFKQKTAYEMCGRDWSSDVCSSDLYRHYAHYNLYRSCLPTYGIAIIRSLSFLFLDHSEGNANISAAIKSSPTVIVIKWIV